MTDKPRAQGVTETVLAVLRGSEFGPDEDITARKMLAAARVRQPDFTTAQLPAITMALRAAETSGLLQRRRGRKGQRGVWRKTQELVPRRSSPASLRGERVDVVPPRSTETQVPLSAVIDYLPHNHPLRDGGGE